MFILWIVTRIDIWFRLMCRRRKAADDEWPEEDFGEETVKLCQQEEDSMDECDELTDPKITHLLRKSNDNSFSTMQSTPVSGKKLDLV